MQSISSPRSSFGFRFVVLARQWRRIIDRHLAEAGLTDATWAPLVHLHEVGDGITQTELAGRIGLDGSSLVRLLDIVCERGLIERRVDSGDRRARRIFLTPTGEVEVARIRSLLIEAEGELLSGITDAEIEAALAVFDRIAMRMETVQVKEST